MTTPDESPLYRRLRKHGSRGIIYVESAEGQPVSPEAARYLVPAEAECSPHQEVS